MLSGTLFVGTDAQGAPVKRKKILQGGKALSGPASCAMAQKKKFKEVLCVGIRRDGPEEVYEGVTFSPRWSRVATKHPEQIPFPFAFLGACLQRDVGGAAGVADTSAAGCRQVDEEGER